MNVLFGLIGYAAVATATVAAAFAGAFIWILAFGTIQEAFVPIFLLFVMLPSLAGFGMWRVFEWAGQRFRERRWSH